jgi:hypothetical protein
VNKHKILFGLRNVMGTAGLVFAGAGFLLAGYVFVTSIPDPRRYITISRM